MNKSLYTKLVIIMLVLILSLMAVVGVFLMNEIRGYYMDDFYDKMKTVFENRELAEDLYTATDEDDVSGRLSDILNAYSGQLGIDSRSRNYYILDGSTGDVLESSVSEMKVLEKSPNILLAISGENGYLNDQDAEFMDVALPISGSGGNFIIYVIDNKAVVSDLTSSMFKIIAEVLLVGLAISILLSLLLAKTMVKPLQSLTKAAERVASGDFSQNLQSDSQDEIGVLTKTFSNMALQLETTLDNLKKSEAMRREFVANVSHELRTPITSIRSYAETLQDSPQLPEKTTEQFLGVIVNESDRMTKIVQDLLTLSRFDAGIMEFSFVKFSFGKSIQDVYNVMYMQAKQNGHKFILSVKEELPQIIGDRTRLEQVIINMVSNAIKYTKMGGSISLNAGVREDKVWVSVRDNGVGIPSDDVNKVFDRFYRVDKARSRESGGTGLGLSIAKEIVNRHDGSINITSKLNKGTTITVYLPIEGPEDKGGQSHEI